MLAAVAVVVGLPFLLKKLGLAHDDQGDTGDDSSLYGHAPAEGGGGGGGGFPLDYRGLAGPQEAQFYTDAAGTGYGADYSSQPADQTTQAIIDTGPGAVQAPAASVPIGAPVQSGGLISPGFFTGLAGGSAAAQVLAPPPVFTPYTPQQPAGGGYSQSVKAV